MKFGVKLILYIIVIIACILSISRYCIIRQSFNYSLNKSIEESINRYIAQKYYLESNIIKNIEAGEKITGEDLIAEVKLLYSYIGETTEKITLFDNNKDIIFSNIEINGQIIEEILSENNINNYYIKKVEKNWYVLFPSKLSVDNENVYMVNIYDITYIYEERERQIREIMIADFIILSVSSIFIAIFSWLLTKPIEKLNTITKRVAKGELNVRVNIKSKDEIGELAESFNIMAEEIENKIISLNLSIKQREDFINGFTHEIKTPMTAIIGYADMLRLKKCDEEVTKTALNYIYSEAKRLEILSHKLMNLMSLKTDKIEFEIVNVKEFFNKIIAKEILSDIEIKIQVQEAEIRADKSLLEVVIKNLIENAKKAKPKDKIVILKRNKCRKW